MAHTIPNIDIIRTKLHRPSVTRDLVPRTLLLERLEYRRQRPLTLISAPAGYGKSTLASSWLEASECPGAWVSLDADDSDLGLFLTYLVAAIQMLFPDAGQQTQAILNAPELPPGKILARTLLNDLTQIEEPFILVLDDYHRIHEEAVHDLLEDVLQHPPPSLHLVLITRRDPPLLISTLRGRGQVTEIRTQDLRFSTEETTTFLQQVLETSIHDKTAEILETKTEGWVTGLRLAALRLHHRHDQDRLLSELPEDNRYVVEYLVSEVFSQQPAAIQEYLLATAMLDRFCASLCETVCLGAGLEMCELSGEEFITWVEETNLFVIALDDRQQWFRYHHMFQKLLVYRLHSQYGPDEIASLHTRASVWFAEHGLIDEALHHALATDNILAATRLIRQHRHDLMNQEQWYRLRRYISLLPRDTVESDPELLIVEAWLLIGWSEMAGVMGRIDALLSAMPPESGVAERMQGEWATLCALVYYHMADGQRALACAQQAVETLPQQHLSERGMAVMLLGLSHQLTGDLESARLVLFGALKEKESRHSTYHSRVMLTFCFIDYMEADLNGVMQTAREVLNLGPEFKLSESIVHGHYFLGISHYDRNELDAAQNHLAAVAEIPSVVNAHNFAFSAFALALTYQAQGHPNEAHRMVESVVSYALHTHNTSLLQVAQAFQAELALRQGRITEINHWVKSFNPDPFVVAYRFYVPQMTLAKWFLAQDTNESRPQATKLLSRLHEFFRSTHNTRLRIEVLALEALLHNAQGDEKAALEAVERALTLAEPGGFIRLFVDLGPVMASLLRRCLSQNGPVSYIGKILAAFRDEGFGPEQEAAEEQEGNQAAALHDQSPKELLMKMRPQLGTDLFTAREREVLNLLTQRLSYQEMADTLIISPKTVKRHVLTIYKKLGAHSRREAIEKADELGVLPGR